MPSNHLILSHPLLPPSIPFSHLQSFLASGSFPMSRFFASGGQSIGVSASISVLPMNIQDWFPLGLTGLIFLQCKGLRSLLQHHSSKASILQGSAFFIVELSYPYMTMGKTIALTRQTFVGKILFLLFNSFSSKEQASFHFMAAVTICSDFGAPQNKACHCCHCFPIYLPWSDGTGGHNFSFLYILSIIVCHKILNIAPCAIQ